MPTTDELLAQVPLFKDLSKKHLKKVSSLATRIDGAPGKVLTTEGEIGREFIVVLEGEVEVRRGDEVLATRGAGDYIGEISLIEHRPRTATVVATTPVALDVIDTGAFHTLLDDEPEIAEKIKNTAKERLAALEGSDL
ncbi:MAG TPA: cyclic nucleotide-binding domain-containing protein [Acidimicrobiia bacterium]